MSRIVDLSFYFLKKLFKQFIQQRWHLERACTAIFVRILIVHVLDATDSSIVQGQDGVVAGMSHDDGGGEAWRGGGGTQILSIY